MIANLAISDLTNDIIGDDADQAFERAFSTSVNSALKVVKSLLYSFDVYS